jgi:uncharacterized protein YcfJ
VPQQQCWDERVTYAPSGQRSYTSVILGSIIGGAIGSEVGHGRHKGLVTAAGAVLGGSIGNDLYQGRRGDSVTSIERRCATVQGYRTEERAVGYRVKYRYRGQVYVTRLDHDPGETVRVAVSVRLAE